MITDRLDRQVNFAQPAGRIISLSPATTELLFALGLGPSVVGVTKHCNFPPEALKIQRVGGGTLESVSLETIVGAKPDLVLCKWDTHQPLVESLERLQIRTLAIGSQSLEELFEEANWLGQITGRDSEAVELVERMRARRQRLTEVVAGVKPDRPIRVFYEVWDEPLMSAGPDSFIGELLTLAGLENIVTDTSIRYPRISAETVLRGNPQLILAPTSHFENVDVETIRARPGWRTIAAVENRRIHLISGDQVSRCGPRLLDALAEIILAAYPTLQRDDLQMEWKPTSPVGQDTAPTKVV
ncbi:MAG: helical backbone metal receptor, partial [Pirellulales bacterium]|nr:helical backbone metal receptor [Pirellulales bacterium]